MARKTIFLLTSVLVSTVLGVAVTGKDECGAPEPTEEHIAVAKEMALNESKVLLSDFALLSDINVPVYVHVVAANENQYLEVSLCFVFMPWRRQSALSVTLTGEPQEQDVRAGIRIMNKNYRKMGFQFSLQGIDYTINANWASGKNGFAMKKLLREGDYRTLNLYYVNTVLPSSTGTITGMCQFPRPGGNSGNALIQDGCVMRRDTVNNGQTTTHEVGHWLGLFHTFQGGCVGRGDMVDDTPACEQTWTCDEDTDTCPDRPGKDPIHNFMSYGNCRREFTYGQAKRARSQYEFYRA
ncbi:hypothetical protein E4U55_003813 [Claviceps digitariae]|nr:hypothetical protein E4U55_003813 [Claviceps digitariae]